MSKLANIVLAHQGGWDEILMFAVPVLLAVWAVRRIERRGRDAEPDPETTSDPADTHPTEAD